MEDIVLELDHCHAVEATWVQGNPAVEQKRLGSFLYDHSVDDKEVGATERCKTENERAGGEGNGGRETAGRKERTGRKGREAKEMARLGMQRV